MATSSRKAAAEARTGRQNRTTRVPFGVPRLTMNIDDDTAARLKAEGKVPRWINDTNDRIQRALSGGYEFVTDAAGAVTVGDAQETQEGNKRIKKRVGKQEDGSAVFAYLMAIPVEFYEEDQAAKEEENMKVDHTIRGGQPKGLGNLDVAKEHGGVELKKAEYQP